MKYSAEQDTDWLSKCSIEPTGTAFVVHLADAPIGSRVEPSHHLHAQIKAELDRRQRETLK